MGKRITALISVCDNNDGNVYNHFNHRGNVINSTNSAGDNVATYLYDAFGSIKMEKGQYDSQFRFSTKEYNASTELIYYGFRYYSPKLGRWISKRKT